MSPLVSPFIASFLIVVQGQGICNLLVSFVLRYFLLKCQCQKSLLGNALTLFVFCKSL